MINKEEFMTWFEEQKDLGNVDKAIWCVTGVILLLGLGAFYSNFKNSNKINWVTVGREYENYIVTDKQGPSPFVVSLKEQKTGKMFENIKIADDCKLFHQKSFIGEELKVFKFTLIDPSAPNVERYYFRGIEEIMCEGRSFTPDSSNNFYIERD